MSPTANRLGCSPAARICCAATTERRSRMRAPSPPTARSQRRHRPPPPRRQPRRRGAGQGHDQPRRGEDQRGGGGEPGLPAPAGRPGRRHRYARPGARRAGLHLRGPDARRHAHPRRRARRDDGCRSRASSGPSGSSSFPNCPPPRSARSTRRRCAPTSPRGWPATEGGDQDDQPERRDDRRRLRQPRAPGQARRALPGLRRGGYDAAVADPRGPDAVPSRTARGAAPVAVGKAVPAGRPQRRAGAGRTGRRAPRHRTGQSRPARRPLRHAHAVGRNPVPRSAGERARAPAHPVRVPVRPGRRGRVDGRRR